MQRHTVSLTLRELLERHAPEVSIVQTPAIEAFSDLAYAEHLAARRGGGISDAFTQAQYELCLRRGYVPADLIRDQGTPRFYLSTAQLNADGRGPLAQELAWHEAKDPARNASGQSCFNMPRISDYGISDALEVIIAHELWHAKLHREGAASSTAPSVSDIWVDEELQAHEVEAKVLDARTKGAYKKSLRDIASGISATSIKRFLLKVQPADIRKLDSLFKPGIQQETDIRAAQYFLNLTETWLGTKYTGEELRQKKIEAYRYLIDPRRSTNVQ